MWHLYSEFNLFLSVYDEKTRKLIERKSVYKTFPDEIFYSKSLRKTLFEEERLLILNFLNKPVCEFYYRDLAKGNIIVNILNQSDAKNQYNEKNYKEFDWIKY